jgi:hypothetical protein
MSKMRTGSISKTPKLSVHKKKNFFGGAETKHDHTKKYKPKVEILEG